MSDNRWRSRDYREGVQNGTAGAGFLLLVVVGLVQLFGIDFGWAVALGWGIAAIVTGLLGARSTRKGRS